MSDSAASRVPGELDVNTAFTRIGETFPDLRPRAVRYFAEGNDFRMFEVDSTWLFRFPKRESEVLRLEREVALMDRLAGRLPVAVPCYEFRAPGLAGYRKLDGQPMVGRTAELAFATSLGEFTSALQAIDVTDLTLPGEQDVGGLEQLRAEIRAGLEAARPLLDPAVHNRCAALLDAPAPAPATTPSSLVHNDLYPAHVLLAGDGAIRAVLDWGDAILGDPAVDLALAYFWGGEAFWQEVIGRTACSVDAGTGFEKRARFGGICMAIGHITYGARVQDPAYVKSGLDSLARIDGP